MPSYLSKFILLIKLYCLVTLEAYPPPPPPPPIKTFFCNYKKKKKKNKKKKPGAHGIDDLLQYL